MSKHSAPLISDLVSHLATSEDGTPIEYLTTGTGPGLVIVHGTMQAAASQSELAALLGERFTVHLVNRRGRGRSGPYPALAQYGVRLEVADIEAVIAATGSRFVLGISSGGIIAAELALTHPELTTILFEPALVADGSLDLDRFLRRFEPEVARGDVPAYMVTALLDLQLGPGFLRLFPRRMLQATTRAMLAKTGPVPPGGADMAELARLVPYDMRLLAERADRIADYAAMTGPVVLLSSTRSPAYLRHAVDRLGALLPHATRRAIARAGHEATQNRRDGGRPGEVCAAIRDLCVAMA